MSLIVNTNKMESSPPQLSPIHSKLKSPTKRIREKPEGKKKSLVKNLLSKINLGASGNKLQEDQQLFSPTLQIDPNELNALKQIGLNPTLTPIKKKNENNESIHSPLAKYGIFTDIKGIDKECNDSVKHVTKLVWDNAKTDIDGFLFMKYAPFVDTKLMKDKCILPPKTKKDKEYTLILDLDETLVHCSIEKTEKYDVKFPVDFNGEKYQVYMKKRPYFYEFLEKTSQLFEIIVFTASQKCYADTLLNLLDPKKKYIKHRLFRTECMPVEGNYIKNLEVLNRDLSKTIIIDNSPPAFTYQIDNGIPIESWYDNINDKELLYIIPILKKLLTVNDVRPYIKKFFKIKKLLRTINF